MFATLSNSHTVNFFLELFLHLYKVAAGVSGTARLARPGRPARLGGRGTPPPALEVFPFPPEKRARTRKQTKKSTQQIQGEKICGGCADIVVESLAVAVGRGFVERRAVGSGSGCVVRGEEGAGAMIAVARRGIIGVRRAGRRFVVVTEWRRRGSTVRTLCMREGSTGRGRPRGGGRGRRSVVVSLGGV